MVILAQGTPGCRTAIPHQKTATVMLRASQLVKAVGCRPECGWNSVWRIPGQHEVIVSGGKVNWLIGGFCGERIPAIHLAHADLSRGEQRPEHHRGGVGRRQYSLSFDPALELLVQPLDRIGRA